MDEPSTARQKAEQNREHGDALADKARAVRRHKRVVIVGIPGVGKSSIVKKIVELTSASYLKPSIVNFGTVMMEEAARHYGVKSRDDMRKFPVETQRKLQLYAASRIASIQDEHVLVDTHLFVSTKEGFWPGMPMDVLEALKPTHLVLVSATADEIKRRRDNDETRMRDKSAAESVQIEIDAARSLLFTSSLICGCPALVVTNAEGQIENTAKRIINAIFQE